MRTEEYLTILTDQIRCRMARGAVREEIRCHIEDQTAAFLSEGMEQAEAEEAAVREMGDPVETGNELNRIHRPRMAWGMIGLIAALSLAGYLIQNFMQEKWIAAGAGAWSSPYSFVYMLAGLAVMMAACFADYTRIAGRAREILILLYLFLAVSPAVLGILSINGSASWIYLPMTGITLNLAYVQLIIVPIYAAVLYRYRGQGMSAVLKAVLWMIPSVLLMARRPNIILAGVLLLTYLVVLAAAVWKKWFRVPRKPVLAGIAVFAAGMPAAAAALTWLFGEGYQRERLRAVLDPSGSEAGYGASLVREVLGGSRMLGGDAADITRLPDLGNFVLSGVIVYYGIIAAVLLAGLILFLFVRFMRISLRQKNQLGMLMGTGCSAVFLLELILYILNNLGVVYVDSYCPFLTSGGTGMIVMYLMLGILLSIYRYQNTAPERKAFARLFRMSE